MRKARAWIGQMVRRGEAEPRRVPRKTAAGYVSPQPAYAFRLERVVEHTTDDETIEIDEAENIVTGTLSL